MTPFALIFGVFLGIGSLAWGYAQAGWMTPVYWLATLGFLWLFSQWRGWGWFSMFGLFGCVLAAVIGYWFELAFEWMLAGAVFALFAWDMSDFLQRLKWIAVDDDIRGMERRHIARVSLLSIASLLLASAALYWQIRFTFEWGVFLVIVILLGLMQLIGWFRGG